MHDRHSLEYFIIDATVPFFAACGDTAGKTINWSKVPFSMLENNGRLDPEKAELVEKNFSVFLERVARAGYNAVTIDDVAHLTVLDFYPPGLKDKIEDYQRLFDKLMAAAVNHGVKVFVTTDIMFSNSFIEAATFNRDGPLIHLLTTAVKRLFKRFAGVHGIIMRLGESDGMDVEDDFRSRLTIRTPSQCRRYLRGLLPVFEKYDRIMIIRTWTLGAYKIGDLMWNPKTYDSVFGGVYSRNLIVSLKFGDTDFYRYLKLNGLFFEGRQRKIVEFQARREYEGFGEFPSFTGFDYEDYARALSHCRNLAGISVWCQTGGWCRFNRLSFITPSIWNEINTYVTLRIFRDGLNAGDSVAEYCREYLPGRDPEKLIKLLAYSESVVKQVWYLPEYSTRCLYFRRVRVPPLIWIFWDTIVVNHMLRKILRSFVRRRKEAIKEGYDNLYKIRRMRQLADEMGIDGKVFDYQYDTFRLIACAREYFLGEFTSELRERIIKEIHSYRQKYPSGFNVEYDFVPVRIKKEIIRLVFRLCLRSRPEYRVGDRIFMVRFSGWLYPLVKIWEQRRFPDFARRQAMGFQILFK